MPWRTGHGLRNMTHKTAYIWGPVSSFTGRLAALLLQKDWHVHLATKSALNVFSLAPLDLRSTAATCLEKALGGHDQLKVFQDRLRFLDADEVAHHTTYDAVIFAGLPANFDESRVPRAPWAAGQLPAIARRFKGVPMFLLSSLFAGVQADGAVPEDLCLDRRKPLTHWEGLCQHYENKLLKSVGQIESTWHLVRLPLLTGSTQTGELLNFSGMFSFLRELYLNKSNSSTLRLKYNPDSTFWFLPVDAAVQMFWRLLEDGSRPRICNLVSTQSVLNREWLQHLASTLGYADIEPAANDNYNLPGVFRRLLTDNISVRTRNLFEVAARYQQAPVKLEQEYFQKLIDFGIAGNWGRFRSQAQTPELFYSEQLACNYFKDFLPEKLNGSLLKELTTGGITIGFHIDEPEALYFALKSDNGQLVVETVEATTPTRVTIRLSGQTLVRLMQNKAGLTQSLITGKVKIEGNVIDTVRIGNELNSFLSKHPYTDGSIAE